MRLGPAAAMAACALMIGGTMQASGAETTPAKTSEKSAAKAAPPATLVHDKRIHGQTVKIEVGQGLEVHVSGGCFWRLLAVGGDSLEPVDALSERLSQGGEQVFRFQGVRAGRTRAVLVRYGPGGKQAGVVVDFIAEVGGAGRAAAAAEVPLLLFEGAARETFTVPVGRRIEWHLPVRDEAGGWTVTGVEGKSVRNDADAPALPPAGFDLLSFAARSAGFEAARRAGERSAPLRFTAVRPGASLVTARWFDPKDASRGYEMNITVNVTPAAKGLAADAF